MKKIPILPIVLLILLLTNVYAIKSLKFFGNSSLSQTLSTDDIPNPWTYGVNLSTMQVYFKTSIESATAIQFQVQNGDQGTRSINYQFQEANASAGIVVGNTITYPEVFDYTNITYTVSPNELSKVLTVWNESAPTSFSFKLQFSGVGYVAHPDTSVTFYDEDTGERLWAIKAPAGLDSAINETTNLPEPNEVDLYYDFRQAGSNFFIDLIVNETDMTQFTYPIYLDPTIGACGTLDNISDPVHIINGTLSISTTGTCFTLGAENITLNCNGSTITGDRGTNDFGVYSKSRNNVTVTDCIIESFGTGIYFDEASNSTITNNTVTNNTNGITMLADSNYSVIANNIIANGTQGFNIQSSYTNLSNNTASNVSNGFYFYLAFYNFITNNTAYNVSQGFYPSSSSNNNLSNNTAFNGTYGFYILSGHNNTVTNNTAYSLKNYAFHLQSSNENNLSLNKAYNSSAGFYFRKGEKNNLSSNTAYNSSYGFLITRYSYNNTIINNTIYNNTLYGVYITGSNDNTFSNNTLNNNTYGFYLIGVEGNNISDNTVQNSTEYDLFVAVSAESHCDNTIQNMTGSGSRPVNFTNESVNWSHLTVSELVLCNADNSSIVNVSVRGSSGIRNNGVIVTISHNVSMNETNSSNNYHGFYVLDSTNFSIFTDNIASNNSQYGIYLDYADYNNISSNTIFNNSEVGIYIEGNPNTAGIPTDNHIFSNTIYNHIQGAAAGIFIQTVNAFNSIYDNTIENNSYGFYFNTSNLLNLTNNTVRQNTLYGFRFESSASNNLSLNNASNNTLVQYFFNHSNATFADTNYAFNLLPGATIMNITNESVVTALVDSTYNTIVTEALNFSFTNATNVTFQNTTADLSTAGVSVIACQSTTTTCYAMSNILTINNNSGSANLTQLLIYYNISRIDDSHYGINDLQIARYNESGGWTSLGSSEVASGYIRYGHIDVFSPFAAIAFESVGTGTEEDTSTTEEDKDLELDHEVTDNTVEVTAKTGSTGVSGVTIRLIYLDTGLPVGSDQTTDSSGEATFTVTESGSYKLTDVSRPSGYANAPDVTFEVTLEDELPETPPPGQPPSEEASSQEPAEPPPEEPPPEEVPSETPPEEEPVESEYEVSIPANVRTGDTIEILVTQNDLPAVSKKIEILTPDGMRLVLITDETGKVVFEIENAGEYKVSLLEDNIPTEVKTIQALPLSDDEEPPERPATPEEENTICVPLLILLIVILVLIYFYYKHRDKSKE